MNYYRAIISIISAFTFYAAFSGGAQTASEQDAASYPMRTTVMALHPEPESAAPAAKPVRIVMPLPYGR